MGPKLSTGDEIDVKTSARRPIHFAFTLVRSAKAQLSRHGKVVLLSPQPNVAKVLDMTQVDRILPVFYDFEQARRAVAPERTAPG